MAADVFVGIDVAVSGKKRLPIVFCSWQGGRLVPYDLRRIDLKPPRGPGNAACLNAEALERFADEAAAYVDDVCARLGVRTVRIAIDAPSSPCGDMLPRRAAEKAMDAEGISCFATPDASRWTEIRQKVAQHLGAGGAASRMPHANQLWMLAGFELFRRLDRIAPCIEVYPQAIAWALGASGVHKNREGGVRAQLRAAARHTHWPQDPSDASALKAIAWAPLHDCLDAYLAAWVAALDETGRRALGEAPADVIWVPQLTD